MTRIVVDAALEEKLTGSSAPLELCDQSGNVLGRFIPKIDWEAIERDRPQRTEEELRLREQTTGGMSIGQVLAHLEKL
ncbi:MAG TPA: hypothetical protein VGX76_24895 [Pirellulales bacterium]|jgi:hypothetical protein|nr:hypothetical protein [Pirellulales bacterium]